MRYDSRMRGVCCKPDGYRPVVWGTAVLMSEESFVDEMLEMTGEEIRSRREKLLWTQQQLADLAGLKSRGTVIKAEQGARSSKSTLRAIAAALEQGEKEQSERETRPVDDSPAARAIVLTDSSDAFVTIRVPPSVDVWELSRVIFQLVHDVEAGRKRLANGE